MANIRLYFAQQPKNISLFEIYREGKPTGEMVDVVMIQKLLDPAQYRKFINDPDERIFSIPGERFRKRNHKRSKYKLYGRSPNNFKFDK